MNYSPLPLSGHQHQNAFNPTHCMYIYICLKCAACHCLSQTGSLPYVTHCQMLLHCHLLSHCHLLLHSVVRRTMYVHHVVRCALTARSPLPPHLLPLAPRLPLDAHHLAWISCPPAYLMALPLQSDRIAALLPPPSKLKGLSYPAIHVPAFSRTAIA